MCDVTLCARTPARTVVSSDSVCMKVAATLHLAPYGRHVQWHANFSALGVQQLESS
eukprot:COSAG01_NODE_38308_length_491_cov_1.073980_1_plen_55_part_10